MNILFLTQIIPYPPDAGPKVKTWHVLRYLIDRGHRVILASFVRPDEQVHLPVLEELCAQVYAVPIRRSRPADLIYWLRSHLTGRPFIIERDDLSAMHTLLNHVLSTQSIDVIHADQLTMTQFPLRIKHSHPSNMSNDRVESNPGPPLVFDAHNAVWTIIDRMGENIPWLFKPVLNLETHRVKKYEGRILQKYDHTLAVTEIDRMALLEAIASTDAAANSKPPDISVIPIAVDTEKLQPVDRKHGSTNILTLGTLHYPPNADGIRWFIQQVFPLIRQQKPDATLTIIGKNPPKDFHRFALQDRSINVTGYVPDLVPYLMQAAIMVIPVRAGGGMRVRILEAFAQAMPVVTTTIGLEGIDALPVDDVFVADTPIDFASDVVRLLVDTTLQSQLAVNGRRLAVTRYDWQVVLKEMDAIYNKIEISSINR